MSIREDVMEIVLGVKKDGKVYKTEDGKLYPADAYLVVEDPERPSTWHLRYKDENGNVDRRLMGAAWAALTSNYRGNPYTGPQKEEALEKLKRLYKQHGWPTPDEQEDEESSENSSELKESKMGEENNKVAGEIEDIRKRAEAAEAEVKKLTAMLKETAEKKDAVIAEMQKKINELMGKLRLMSRMSEIKRELSAEEQSVVASMSDEQWALFKRFADERAPSPPFRKPTPVGEDGDNNERVTLSLGKFKKE